MENLRGILKQTIGAHISFSPKKLPQEFASLTGFLRPRRRAVGSILDTKTLVLYLTYWYGAAMKTA